MIRLVESGELEVDDQGRVWRVAMRCGCRWHGTKVIKVERRRAEHDPGVNKYLQVRAVIDGKREYAGAARLVWQHFFGEIPDGMILNHLNGNKRDNRPSNLEVTTYSNNQKHAFATGLIDQDGERNPLAVLTNEQARAMREEFAKGNVSQRELGLKFGVNRQVVGYVVCGRGYRNAGGAISEPRQFHYDHLRRHKAERLRQEAPPAIAAILRQEGKLP